MSYTPKFRPYLSQDEFELIIDLLKDREANRPSFEVSTLKFKLMKLMNDVAAGKRTPDSVSKAMTLEEKLGAGKNATPLEKRTKAFEKWSKYPELCTHEELDMVQTYRYDSELMSEEERIKFEDKMNGEF